MSDELKDQRIPIMMTASEVAAIDDWSFANRIRSRAEAIRRLCQVGLSVSTRAPEYAAVTGVYLDRMKAANDALEKLQEGQGEGLAENLAEYVDRVTDLIAASGTLFMETSYYQGSANGAASDGDVEKVVAEAAENRRLFRDHFFGVDGVFGPDDK